MRFRDIFVLLNRPRLNNALRLHKLDGKSEESKLRISLCVSSIGGDVAAVVSVNQKVIINSSNKIHL